MAYTPTTWASGDTITATKLNKMESGIANAGGALIVTIEDDTLDKTWQEIHDAVENGQVVLFYYTTSDGKFACYLSSVEYDSSLESYSINLFNADSGAVMWLGTSTANGYPEHANN